MSQIVVIAFYKFVPLPDYEVRKPLLKEACVAIGVKGTILLASEGINGMLGGTREQIDAILAHLHSDERFADLEHKESYTAEMPFIKMKVRLKREIVALGVPTVNPLEKVGTYIKPKDWNALITDPEVIVIDTRNDFEYEHGTFKNAIDPKTEYFRDFPKFVAKELD